MIIINPTKSFVDRARAEISLHNSGKFQQEAFVAMYQYQYPVNLRHFGRRTKEGLIVRAIDNNDPVPAKWCTSFLSFNRDQIAISPRKYDVGYIEVLACAYTNIRHFVECIEALKREFSHLDIFVLTYSKDELKIPFRESGFKPFERQTEENQYNRRINGFAYAICDTMWFQKNQ